METKKLKNKLQNAGSVLGDAAQVSDKGPALVLPFPATHGPQGDVELTEDGIAEDFASLHEADLRFDHTRGVWFVWTGTHWQLNKTNLGFDRARRHARELRGKNTRLGSKNAVQGVEYMARSDPRLSVTSKDWDSDPFLLATPGGTVDLRSGELRKSKREDFITRIAKVTPAPKGTECPKFKTFLDQITQGDDSLARFLQQWAGYCLTGDTREHCLLFIYGPGSNGKTVFMNVLREIMGDYAASAAMQTFVASKHQRHLTELAMLDGPRLVVASETEKGQEWSQSRVNELTGGDPITANFMRQDHFTFIPEFKLTIIGNHKPKLGTVNDAARRRFAVVPFNYKPAEPDLNLLSKLEAELPAILRWMIDGCLDWQENGLVRPDIVKNATAEYFEEQDLPGQWMDEACDCADGLKATATELYSSWKEFATSNGEEASTQTMFGSMLAQRGFKKKKSNGSMVYFGIALKSITNLNFGKHSDQF